MESPSARLRGAALGTLALLVGIGLCVLIWPFLPALLWATVLSILAEPLFVRMRTRFSPNASALLATIGTLLIVGLPLLLVGAVLYVQLSTILKEAASAAPSGQNGLSVDFLAGRLDDALRPVLDAVAPNFSVQGYIRENKEDLTRALGAPAGSLARQLVHTAVTLVIAFLTMFFMLRDGHRLKGPLLELFPMPSDRLEALLLRLVNTVRGVFVGVVLVAIAQGALATGAYYATGAPNALMWGLLTTVLCTIPLLGAPLIYVPLSLILFAHDKPVNGVILLALGFGLVSQIDNLLKPFVIGARLDLHPMAVFFGLFGGVVLLGPIGLFVGPMLLVFALSLIAELRERLNGELPPEIAKGAPST